MVATDSANEWSFESGEIVRERHEQHAPGGVSLGKSEYRIKMRLRGESDGGRFYHVDTQEGGTHLYSAGAIEGRYEVIDASESREFEGSE